LNLYREIRKTGLDLFKKIKKESIFNLLRIVISAGLIVYLILYVDIDSIYNKLILSNISIILAVILLSFFNLFLQYEKWRLVCYNQLEIKDRKRVLYSLFYGISAGIFTPMKFGEYVARAIPFEGKNIVDVSIATLVDKFIPMIIVLVIGLFVSLYYLVDIKLIELHSLLNLLVFFIFFASVFFILFKTNRKRFISFFEWLKSFKILKKIFDKTKIINLLHGKYFLRILFISLIYHLTFTSQLALLIYAFSNEFNYLLYLYIANLVIFVQVIIPPVALGELGVREGATVYFANSLGLDPSTGFNAALFLFIINFILPSFYGLFFLTKKLK
jgi:uncharacterized protein (TIRG00374 family)